MRGRIERIVVAAAISILAAPGVAAAADAAPEEGALVLAMFGVPRESYWSRAAVRLAERYDARIEVAWTLKSLDETCVGFRLPAGKEPGPLVEALRADRRVTLAQPVQTFRTLGRPGWNDTYAELQTSLEELGLAAAQSFATGRGVRVTVVDTGIDLSHPELTGRVVEARNFVERGEKSFTTDAHGTAIAGVIAAAANNGIGIVGVAPRAELVALKACWPDPPGSRSSACDTYTLAQALDHAVLSETRVLNLSLAGPEDPLLARLLDRAEQNGQLVVAAADAAGGLPFPASHPTTLSVRSARSGHPPPAAGPDSDVILAPGEDILTTGPGGTFDFFSGSSLAAAHVSGIAALVLERKPGLTPAQLRAILRSALGRGSDRAAGPAACAALAAAMGLEVCADAGAEAPPPATDPL